MGGFHAELIDQTPGLKTIAVCDINPERIEAAKQELPQSRRLLHKYGRHAGDGGFRPRGGDSSS